MSSLILVLVLFHLAMTTKTMGTVTPVCTPIRTKISADRSFQCTKTDVQITELPTMVCDTPDPVPDPAPAAGPLVLASNCQVLEELGSPPPTSNYSNIHCVIPGGFWSPEMKIAVSEARAKRTSCTDYDTDICLDWAVKDKDDNDNTSTIKQGREILEAIKIKENYVPKVGVKIQDEYLCSEGQISELATGKVISDYQHVLTPRQKFLRNICYLDHRDTSRRQSLFKDFLVRGEILHPHMRAKAYFCEMPLLSCKTLSSKELHDFDIKGIGTNEKVSVCVCSDYDAIEVNGKCRAKPLTPCQFNPGSLLTTTTTTTCVQNAECTLLTADNKKEFERYYTGFNSPGFIKEFIMEEATHICECNDDYIRNAAGQCIADLSSKLSFNPLILQLPIFITLIGLWQV